MRSRWKKRCGFASAANKRLKFLPSRSAARIARSNSAPPWQWEPIELLRVGVAEPLDPWNVAVTLAAVVRRENADFVLMGKQAIDDDSNQAGQFLAALLDWPQATFASKIELENAPAPATARVDRETDAGIETVSVKLPAVITADLRLNEPRYASLPSIIKARKKPIEFIAAEELGVTLEPRVELVHLEIASSERTCVRVKDVAELVHRLRHEAKVV